MFIWLFSFFHSELVVPAPLRRHVWRFSVAKYGHSSSYCSIVLFSMWCGPCRQITVGLPPTIDYLRFSFFFFSWQLKYIIFLFINCLSNHTWLSNPRRFNLAWLSDPNTLDLTWLLDLRTLGVAWLARLRARGSSRPRRLGIGSCVGPDNHNEFL
jgi:hypothetical protein